MSNIFGVFLVTLIGWLFIAAMGALSVRAAKRDKKMICPFCNEDDFDAPGLKYHFTYCEEYAKVPPISFCNHCGYCLDCLRIERNEEEI